MAADNMIGFNYVEMSHIICLLWHIHGQSIPKVHISFINGLATKHSYKIFIPNGIDNKKHMIIESNLLICQLLKYYINKCFSGLMVSAPASNADDLRVVGSSPAGDKNFPT